MHHGSHLRLHAGHCNHRLILLAPTLEPDRTPKAKDKGDECSNFARLVARHWYLRIRLGVSTRESWLPGNCQTSALSQALAGAVWQLLKASWGTKSPSRNFDHILVPHGESQGLPGSAKSRIACVLSSHWSEPNPAHSGFCLGPGAGRRCLVPHRGHLG